MNDIRIYKLTTGEEIIGKDVTEKGNIYPDYSDNLYLENVRVIVVQPNERGQVGIGFMPFMFSSPNGVIKIPKHSVLGDPVEETNEQLMRAYLQNTSSLDLTSTLN